jgi:hypothetical protein
MYVQYFLFLFIFSMCASFYFIINNITTMFLPLAKIESLCHVDI